MKTLIILIFVLFVSVGFSQQGNTNGWGIVPCYGGIINYDSTITFLLSSSQIFKNYGAPLLVTVTPSPGLFAINWSKVYLSRILPKKISGEFNLLEIKNNVDSVEVYLAIQDEFGAFCLLGQKFVLRQGWQTLVWDMTPVPSFITSFNRTTFVFEFRTSDTSNTWGILELRNLTGIDGLNRFAIDTSLVTQIEDLKQNPENFFLYQNYPNPFNPLTTIRFSVPERGQVSLIVFNSLGQEIQTLVNEDKIIGSYEVLFNASNLPSGVYFYRLQVGSFVETKKMSFLK